MAGPVRLAYRSREAGEGGIDVRARLRPPSPRGRWVRCIRSRVIARPVPPTPRSSAVVDPRIGDLGPALLALEDGTVFPGVAFGASVAAGGDLVVNTSQTGYQEVCTDPSYAGQVVVMTYPLIGNYGRLVDDDQSLRPWLRGLVVANATAAVLEDARQLAALLRDEAIPAIAGVDTRALARHLRANGCLRGDRHRAGRDRPRRGRRGRPRRAALGGPGLRRPGLAVGRQESASRRTAVRWIGIVDSRPEDQHRPRRCAVAARASASCRTRRRPRVVLRPTSTAWSCRPAPATRPGSRRQVALARAVIDDGRPLLGICLGHQIVGRAAGAETRAAAVRAPRREPPGPGPRDGARPGDGPEPRGPGGRRFAAGGGGFRVSQVNLNDGSVEGLRHASMPIETVQYHPEGAPGPLDALAVFDRFVAGARPREARPSTARGREAGLGPDPRLRARRHRPGGRVRLRGDAGLPRAARRGRPDDPRQLEPGDDHDRPLGRRRRLPRAADGRGRRGRHRAGATRGPARRARRPDRAEPRDRHGRGRRLRAARRPAARARRSRRSGWPRTARRSATCSTGSASRTRRA